MWYALATVLAALLLARGAQEPRTTLRLHVVDGQSAPVALLRVTLEDAEGASHTVITDAAGEAVVGPLPGTIVFVRAAQLAQRLDLTVEPTTATEGMRLGLIPHQERTVRLIVDGGLLFLDPEVLFPAATPTVDTPDGASPPASARAMVAPPTPAMRPSSAAAASTPPAASSRSRSIGLLAVAASTIVVLMSIIVVRRRT